MIRTVKYALFTKITHANRISFQKSKNSQLFKVISIEKIIRGLILLSDEPFYVFKLSSHQSESILHKIFLLKFIPSTP